MLTAILFYTLGLTTITAGVHAQSIRRDLPPNALPKNVITSFHRRAVENTDSPWQSIGRVNIGGRAHCSGTLVATDVVLTAAHCLYSKRDRKMVVPSIVHFLAGYAKGEYRGHSKVKSYIVGTGYDGARGPGQANAPHDWALLSLEVALGDELGFLSVPSDWFDRPAGTGLPRPAPRNVEIEANITTAGYPGDRKHILSLEEDCKILATAQKGKVLFTSCIALKGDSGGPILQRRNEDWHIIGLQTAAIRVGEKISGVGLSAIAYQPYLASLQQ